MSALLDKIRARQEAEAKNASKENKESVVAVKATVSSVVTQPSNEVKKEIVAAEKSKIEANARTIVLPSSVYEIEGLNTQDLEMGMIELQQRLEADEPLHKSLMSLILGNLKNFEELAYLLTDDQLGLISRAAMRVSNIEIAAKKPPAKKKSKIDLTKVDLSEIKL